MRPNNGRISIVWHNLPLFERRFRVWTSLAVYKWCQDHRILPYFVCLYNDLKILIHHRMNYFKFNNWPIYLFYILKILTSFTFILVYMSSWVIYKLICRVRNLVNMRWCDLFSIIFLPQCHFLPIFFENQVYFLELARIEIDAILC